MISNNKVSRQQRVKRELEKWEKQIVRCWTFSLFLISLVFFCFFLLPQLHSVAAAAAYLRPLSHSLTMPYALHFTIKITRKNIYNKNFVICELIVSVSTSYFCYFILLLGLEIIIIKAMTMIRSFSLSCARSFLFSLEEEMKTWLKIYFLCAFNKINNFYF